MHVLLILSRQARHQLEICFLRSASLETADQTPPSDYRPIVIGNRPIGAPPTIKYPETKKCIMVFTKVLNSATVFNIILEGMFLEQQISVLE